MTHRSRSQTSSEEYTAARRRAREHFELNVRYVGQDVVGVPAARETHASFASPSYKAVSSTTDSLSPSSYGAAIEAVGRVARFSEHLKQYAAHQKAESAQVVPPSVRDHKLVEITYLTDSGAFRRAPDPLKEALDALVLKLTGKNHETMAQYIAQALPHLSGIVKMYQQATQTRVELFEAQNAVKDFSANLDEILNQVTTQTNSRVGTIVKTNVQTRTICYLHDQNRALIAGDDLGNLKDGLRAKSREYTEATLAGKQAVLVSGTSANVILQLINRYNLTIVNQNTSATFSLGQNLYHDSLTNAGDKRAIEHYLAQQFGVSEPKPKRRKASAF
jgi:hypothetical protein